MARRLDQQDRKVVAADVIAFIETCLFVPEGRCVGQPLRLQPWQKDWIRLVYDNPAGTRRAILSTPRKNAKTCLSAALLLAHLCGPPAHSKPNSQLFSGSAVTRPGRNHLRAGGENGSNEPRFGPSRHYTRDG